MSTLPTNFEMFSNYNPSYAGRKKWCIKNLVCVKYVTLIFHYASYFWDKNNVNKALENKDDGAAYLTK